MSTWFFAGLLLSGTYLIGAQLFVDSSTVSAGSCGVVAVYYNSLGDRVSSLQLDLVFDNSLLNLAVSAGSTVHSSIKSLYSANLNSSSWRILLTSMNRNVLNDGPVLTLFVNVLSGAPASGTSVVVTNVAASDPDGNFISIPDQTGAITITGFSGNAQPLLNQGVLNGASLLPGSIAPGEIISLIGSAIGPQSPALFQITSSGLVDTVAGDYRVFFGSVPAPLLYSSRNQINAIVPFEVAGNPTTTLIVMKGNEQIASSTLDVEPFAVGVFTQSATGVGQALIANEDGTLNGTLNPAPPGSVVTVYVTGGGQTDPPGWTGSVSSQAGNTLGFAEGRIDGHPVEIMYAGPAPGSVAGLIQINLRVPPTATASPAAPLTVTIGSHDSQDGVTLAIGSSP